MRLDRLEHDSEEYLVASYPIRRPASFALLTGAELAVVDGVLDGLSQRAIAKKRGVSVRTVANQLASAYRKLGVCGATELMCLVHAG